MSQPSTGQYSEYNIYCFLIGYDKQTDKLFKELIAVLPFLSEKGTIDFGFELSMKKTVLHFFPKQ